MNTAPRRSPCGCSLACIVLRSCPPVVSCIYPPAGWWPNPAASRCVVWKQMVDQWALITGASSGIGAEFARQLAARGMHLILTARRSDLMESLANELQTKHAAKCEIIPCDLSELGAIPNLLEEIRRRGLAVQLLV